MNTIDFIKKNNLQYQPIRIDSKKKVTGPKYPEGKLLVLPSCNDSKDTCENRIEDFGSEHIAIHSSKDLCVIDIDLYEKEDSKYNGELSDEADEWVEDMKVLLPWTQSTTKKRGLHLYFRPDNAVKKFIKTKARHPDFPYKQIEILSGSFVFESINKKFHNGNINIPMLTTDKIPYDFVQKPTVSLSIKKPKKKSKVDKAVDLLTSKQADLPKNEWIVLLSQIKYHGEKYKEKARDWSKKSTRYRNDEDFDFDWERLTPLKPLVESTNTEEIYSEFNEIFGDNYIINHFDGKPTYYIFDNINLLWRRDDGLNFLKHKILKTMKPIYQENLIESIKENDADEGKIYKKKLELLNKINGGGINDIAKLFIINRADPSKKNIEFDNKEHLYHFENKTIDLTTMTLVERKKEDFATMTGCKLIENFDNKKMDTTIEFWDNLLSDVFPKDDEKDNWIQLMSNSFSGKVLEKFIIENGSGSNGKSFLNDVLRYIHKDYAFKGNVSILTKKIGDNGNPAIANMDKKRFCIFDEPCEEDTIEFSVIKTMTGSSIINARKLFSNDTRCIMAGIKVLECNEKLKLSGNTGDSMQRRAIDVLYRNHFKLECDIPKDNTQTNIKIAKPEYKSKDWLEKNTSGLIYYFLKYMTIKKLNFSNLEKISLCESIALRTKSYIEDSNDILQIVLTYCDYSTEEVFTEINDIYNYYTNSNDYANLTKREKKRLSKLKIRKSISTDPQLKDFYVHRHENSLGWLKNYKIKEEYDEPI